MTAYVRGASQSNPSLVQLTIPCIMTGFQLTPIILLILVIDS